MVFRTSLYIDPKMKTNNSVGNVYYYEFSSRHSLCDSLMTLLYVVVQPGSESHHIDVAYVYSIVVSCSCLERSFHTLS